MKKLTFAFVSIVSWIGFGLILKHMDSVPKDSMMMVFWVLSFIVLCVISVVSAVCAIDLFNN